MSEAARLDEALMNEVVDPQAMRRTVEQGRRRRDSSPSRFRERSPARTRERSPILRLKDRSPAIVGNRFGSCKAGGSALDSSRPADQILGYNRPGSGFGRSRSGGLGGSGVGSHRAKEPSPLRRTGVGRLERSPVRRERLQKSPPGPRRGRVFDYDDPRPALERDNQLFKRRLTDKEVVGGASSSGGGSSMNGMSPLQGSKVVINNLQTSVTEEDILELFGDIGALKKAKLVTPGHAEVTFVQRREAQRAVEVYHNRQLDGKPMKCTLVGQDAATLGHTNGNAFKLPQSLIRRGSGGEARATPPDIESIHRALFMNKKNVGKKPLFTITMPKKSKDEPRNLRMSPDFR